MCPEVNMSLRIGQVTEFCGNHGMFLFQIEAKPQPHGHRPKTMSDARLTTLLKPK